MSNKEFLERISFILGGRKKHPWGHALGIRSTRITQMFLGQVPTADALEIIHRAEGVSIDWLLTGDAAPFCVRHLTDQDGVALLRKQNGAEHYYLLTTPELTRIPAWRLPVLSGGLSPGTPWPDTRPRSWWPR